MAASGQDLIHGPEGQRPDSRENLTAGHESSTPFTPHPHTADRASEPAASPTQEDTYVFRGLAARKQSAARVWIKGLGRWLTTAVFIVAVYAVLIGYDAYDVLSKTQKRQFSALITGLLIALALITLSHLTRDVLELRWWMLSQRPRSRQKVSNLLRCHSMGAVAMLALKSRRWTIHLAVTCWILLLLGSQIAYAAIPLCFSVEKTQNTALLRPGNVSIANLEAIETNKVIASSRSSIKAQQYTANSYGTISLAYVQDDTSNIPWPGTLWYSDDPLLFCDNSRCTYVFLETNPESLRNPDAIPVIATTDRTVNVTSQCTSFPVVQGGNGTQDTIVIGREDDTFELTLPVRGGIDQSTFITEPSSPSCGEDCGTVSVFEASATSSWYYNCTTTLSRVSNAILPEHSLGANLTAMVATAIALQGFSSEANDVERSQYQIYPSASVFGVPLNGVAADMASLLSRFAIGVVAIAAEANEYVTVAGHTPHIGQKLSVSHWGMIHLIFGLTAGLQLVFAVTATCLARRVVTPPGGSIAEAQVLRMMGADSNTIDEKGSHPVRDRWIYRDHHVGGGIYDLHMESVGLTRDRISKR